MSDTPRTDFVEYETMPAPDGTLAGPLIENFRKLARQLERELAAAKKDVASATIAYQKDVASMARERNEAIERAEKAEARVAELERISFEQIATKLPSDPFDERDGLWFGADEVAALKRLPGGTKLYVKKVAAPHGGQTK